MKTLSAYEKAKKSPVIGGDNRANYPARGRSRFPLRENGSVWGDAYKL
jgi:hypothetical protein